MSNRCHIHLDPIHTESRPGDVKHSQADIAKARDLMGYAPQVDAFTGLERTIDWYRKALGS